MCEVKRKGIRAGKRLITLDVTCKKTGLPITISKKHGVYCVRKCGEEKDKRAHKFARAFLAGFIKGVGWRMRKL